MTGRIREARESALWYRDAMGWNPLPSLANEKRPSICYSEYRTNLVPEWVYRNWDQPNVQLVCGARWGLAVIDIDGALAVQAWQSMTLHRPNPMTWCVLTGSGGWHQYYTVPSKIHSLPSRTLWESSERHSKVELLADKRLVVAPPSRHVESGNPYLFIRGPRDQASPALLPTWVMDLPAVGPPKAEWTPCRQAPPVAPADLPEGHFDRRAVLAAIPDKLGLAASWGLRIVREGTQGWWICHAIDREDSHPSASIHSESGCYFEPGVGRRHNLFGLAVALGRYRDWREACNHLGSKYVSVL